MKTAKKLLCLLLCFVICFSLCSCNFLDEMREKQAFWGKNDTIIYQGKIYKKLTQCQFFDPENDTEKYLRITKKDVPVMLSDTLGDSAEIFKDNSIISLNKNNYDEYNGYYYNDYYAREDVYESLEKRINSLDYFDGYAFEYTVYEENERLDYEIADTKWQMISSEANDTLDFLFEIGGGAYVDPSYVEEYYLMDIYQVSKDFNFKKNCGSLYNTPSGIYFSTFDEYEGTKYIQISVFYQDIFEEIIKEFEKLDEDYKINFEENSSSIY